MQLCQFFVTHLRETDRDGTIEVVVIQVDPPEPVKLDKTLGKGASERIESKIEEEERRDRVPARDSPSELVFVQGHVACMRMGTDG